MNIFRFNKVLLKNEKLFNDFFFSTLEKKLLNAEFAISQNNEIIKFQRNLIARNDVSDHLGLYRRVQVRGNIKMTKADESKTKLEITTFFYFQFFAIILGFGIPVFLITLFNKEQAIILVSIYVVICVFYYLISVNTGKSIVEKIITESLRESYLNHKGVKRVGANRK